MAAGSSPTCLTLQVPARDVSLPVERRRLGSRGSTAPACAASCRLLRRRGEAAGRLAIRHVSGHQVIALVEIVSSANKDRATHVMEFVDKAANALWHGIHVLLIDLFPPGRHDAQGMHAAIWERFEDEPYLLPPGEPLTLASYVAGPTPTAYLEHLNVGSSLPDMPLFLTADRYVNVPLEASYQAAYRGLPAFWRDVLEGRQPSPRQAE
jgi:hypothetical protein